MKTLTFFPIFSCLVVFLFILIMSVYGRRRSLLIEKRPEAFITEPFCASSLTCSPPQDTTLCDANRKDFTLGLLPDPEPCRSRVISPQWTYWYYPNIQDTSCDAFNDPEHVPTDYKHNLALLESSDTTVSVDESDSMLNADRPFGFNPLAPARTDCPLVYPPPYVPVNTRDLTIPTF